MKKKILIAGLMSSMLLMGGCGGSDTTVSNTNVTMGQELIDLKARNIILNQHNPQRHLYSKVEL